VGLNQEKLQAFRIDHPAPLPFGLPSVFSGLSVFSGTAFTS